MKTTPVATMDINTNEECLLFVDDSNVWIEAQKFAASGNSHMPKLEDGDHDPRLRIDIGRLVNTVYDGRIQRRSYIYGSRPPPNDSVWDQYNKRGFETKIYDRGANGKEKQVDNSMAADLTEEAVELRVSARGNPVAKQLKDRTIFIVITGDRDLLPAVKKVLESDIRVELWGWKSGMAKEYLRERNGNSLLSVKFLDDIFSQISFTNYRSTRNTRVDPDKTIVICEPEYPVGETWDEDSIGGTIIQLGRLFYTTRSKTGPEIFVEFPRVSNIEAIIHKAQELFGGKTTIISWPIYASRFNKDLSVMVETRNMFSPLGNDDNQLSPRNTMNEAQCPQGSSTELGSPPRLEDGHTEAQEVQSLSKDPDNQEGWQQVKSRSHLGKAHANAIRQSQQCPKGQRCGAKGDCGYKHTIRESNRFRENANENVDFSKWRTKSCKFGSSCRKGERCPFAHSKKEAWCLSCDGQGHYTEECRR